jgi:hypothetical protein
MPMMGSPSTIGREVAAAKTNPPIVTWTSLEFAENEASRSALGHSAAREY